MEQDSVQHDKHERMLTDPVRPLVLRMAGPSIVIMLITAFYNMADTYFVGTVGTSAIAAVGVSFALMNIIQAIGFFFGHGTGNYISRQLGAGHSEVAESMASTGFLSAFAAGTLLGVGGLLFLEPLAVLLGATDTILPHAVEYLRYILIATPFMVGSFVLNNLLRFQGNTFHGMIGMTAGGVLNIALDPLFIYGFHMGAGGAGLATMISQMVSCSILLICSNRLGNIPIRLRSFRPSRARYREMVRGGTPSLVRQSIASVAGVCLNQVAGPYGDAAIAAFSIVTRCTMFAQSALLGFGQGFQPVCGFNYGAGRYDRVREAFWFCVKFSFGALLALALAGFVFSPSIVGAFRDDAAVVEIGTFALRLQCLTFPMMGWMVMGNMLLQTIGMALKSSLLSMARQGLFYLPMLFLFSALLGLRGLQITQPAADLATLTLSIPLVGGVLRQMREAMEAKAAKDGVPDPLPARGVGDDAAL